MTTLDILESLYKEPITEEALARYESLRRNYQLEVCVLIADFGETLESAIDKVHKDGIKHYIGMFRGIQYVGRFLVTCREEFPELNGIPADSRIFDYIDYSSVVDNYRQAGTLRYIDYGDPISKIWYEIE